MTVTFVCYVFEGGVDFVEVPACTSFEGFSLGTEPLPTYVNALTFVRFFQALKYARRNLGRTSERFEEFLWEVCAARMQRMLKERRDQ